MAEPLESAAAPATAEIVPAESADVLRVKSERALATFETPFESVAAYRHFLEVARTFSVSIFVPEHFRGKPGDCLIALNLAKRMDEDPLLVMQSVYVIGGRPAWYTTFMIARANRRAGFKSKIRWKVEQLSPAELDAGSFKLPNIKVTAFAIDEFGDEISEWVDARMAIAEQWTKNAKYRTMPERMLKYRAASALIRMYAPDVMMGLPTVEEAAEGIDLAGDGTEPATPPVSRTSALAAKLAASIAPAEPEDEPQGEPGEGAEGLVVEVAAGEPPAEETTLPAGVIARLRALAEREGVSVDDVEGHFERKLAEMPASMETEVEAEIRERGKAAKGRGGRR